MKSTTIKVDAKLAREAETVAARQGTSLSRLVADYLRTLLRRDQAYAAAKRSALRHLRKGFNLGWRRPVRRDELHDREGLR
jgi:hypothetical protein